jgi:methionyl aminopeptidase
MNIKTPLEIELMRESGHRLGRVLRAVAAEVKAGITTQSLDDMAHALIKAEGGTPAFLGYKPNGASKPYPAVSCISINSTVVHGVPGPYVIQDGDIVKVDLGLVYKGWYSDSAVTVAVGDIPADVKKMIATTEEALRAGINAARVGNTLGDIGYAIETVVTRAGFYVVDSLTGHGVGRKLHEEPWVYNSGERGKGEKLVEGMVIAIEPMVAMGGSEVDSPSDDSFVTSDGSLAAHFEHTIAILAGGPEVLTK